MSDPLTIDINSEYIQTLYNERDEALARNRELEAWMEAAQSQINSMSSETTKALADRAQLFLLAMEWQKLVQDYEDLDLQDPLDQYALWDERWKALKERTEQLTGVHL